MTLTEFPTVGLRKKLSDKYSHRTIKSTIGHNLPQEAPKAFVAAIFDVAAEA
jgi:hypothetical protein